MNLWLYYDVHVPNIFNSYLVVLSIYLAYYFILLFINLLICELLAIQNGLEKKKKKKNRQWIFIKFELIVLMYANFPNGVWFMNARRETQRPDYVFLWRVCV